MWIRKTKAKPILWSLIISDSVEQRLWLPNHDQVWFTGTEIRTKMRSGVAGIAV
jgi:hypothetical protein